MSELGSFALYGFVKWKEMLSRPLLCYTAEETEAQRDDEAQTCHDHESGVLGL